MNAQSGVCTPAGGLMTGERPLAHMRTTFPGPRREAGGKERRGRGGGAVGSGAQLCPWGEGPRGGRGRGGRTTRPRPCRPAGALVLLSLDYLTSLFYYIPKSALAAVIIMAVAPLFDTKILGTLWRVKSMCLLGVAPRSPRPPPAAAPAGPAGGAGALRGPAGTRLSLPFSTAHGGLGVPTLRFSVITSLLFGFSK